MKAILLFFDVWTIVVFSFYVCFDLPQVSNW